MKYVQKRKNTDLVLHSRSSDSGSDESFNVDFAHDKVERVLDLADETPAEEGNRSNFYRPSHERVSND